MPISTKYLKIKDIEIPISIKSYKNSKSIKIYFKGNVLTVTKPTRLSMKKLMETLKENEEDIYNFFSSNDAYVIYCLFKEGRTTDT